MNGASNSPFANTLTLSDPFMSTPGTSWANNSPAITAATLPVFVTSVVGLDPTYRAPGVAQYSLGVQHELRPALIAQLQYVGNVGWHQSADRQINNFPLTTSLQDRADAGDPTNKFTGGTGVNSQLGSMLGNVTIPTANQLVTYQGYGTIRQSQNDLNLSYNALQAGLRIQNKWGLSGEADYTWSHEIDISSLDINSSATGGLSNPWNSRYDKGSGILDRRNILSINYVYQLPFFSKQHDLVHAIAGGWQVAGTIIDESGTPTQITFSPGYDTIGLGGGYTNRPNISGKMSYPKKRGEWFDTSKFSNPTPVWAGGINQGFGNAGKDAIVGPGRVNFTTSLYKVFAFTERVNFRLNIESFNTFNHSEWNGVNTNYAGSTGGGFGTLTTAYDPRNLELGGKLTF
jgi:hypothetical protein